MRLLQDGVVVKIKQFWMVILLSADQIFRTQGRVDYRIGGYNKTDVNGCLLTADKIYYRCKKQSAK